MPARKRRRQRQGDLTSQAFSLPWITTTALLGCGPHPSYHISIRADERARSRGPRPPDRAAPACPRGPGGGSCPHFRHRPRLSRGGGDAPLPLAIRCSRVLNGWQGGERRRVQTHRVAESAGTGDGHTLIRARAGVSVGVQNPAVRGQGEVEDDVVGVGVVAGYATDCRAGRPEMIEVEAVTNPQCDHVVGAGGITAHADAPDLYAALLQEHEPATEDVHAADALADQRVVRGAERRGVPLVSDFRIDWIAVLQTIEGAAWLDGRVQIGRGKRQTIRKETACRYIGFLSQAEVIRVIGDQRSPHVEAEASIAGYSNRAVERGLKSRLARQARASRIATVCKSRTRQYGNPKADRD